MNKYEKCQVVMLPTEKALLPFHNERITQTLYDKNQLKYLEDEGFLYFFNHALYKALDKGWQQQHLYILSDEEIKEQCYAYSITTNKVEWLSELQIKVLIKENWKKIIATTDSTLRTLIGYDRQMQSLTAIEKLLPRPSDAFIKAYCEQGGIDKVMVERIPDEDDLKEYHQEVNYRGHSDTEIEYHLKVASDNTITILPVKPSYSPEEVRNLIMQYALEVHNVAASPDLGAFLRKHNL